MMSEASFASLGPTLLARKGGAKPAMRPQLTPLPDNMSEIAALAEEQLEDLGWNDMGGEDEGRLASNEPGLVVSNAPSQTAALAFDADGHEEGYEDEGTGPHPIIDPLTSADIYSITPQAVSRAPANEDTLDGSSPVITRQQKRLAQRILAETAMETIQAQPHEAREAKATSLLRKKDAPSLRASKSAAKSKAKGKSARRAAFTLRLDPERHLKLRLVATMQGISAQSLVTEALDALLEDIADLDTLVERMTRN